MTECLERWRFMATIVAASFACNFVSAQMISDPFDVALLPVQYVFTRLGPGAWVGTAAFHVDAVSPGRVAARIRSTQPLYRTWVQLPHQVNAKIRPETVTSYGGTYTEFDGGLPGPFILPTNDSGYQYMYEFPSQGAGRYIVHLIAEMTLTSEIAVITELTSDSPLAVTLIAVNPEVAVGDKAVLTAAVFDGPNAVVGANVPATIISPSGAVSTVALTDLGEPLKGDHAGRDGLYSGVFTASEAGEYTIHASITGHRSNGTYFQRDAGANVRAFTPCATLHGFLADYGQDDNNNGRYEWLVIEAEATVTTASTYILQVGLETTSGKTLGAYGQELTGAPGIRQLKARVRSDEIQAAGDPGPYAIVWVELSCVGENGAVSAGRFFPNTNTHPYRLEQFEPPPPPDCNHNNIGDPVEIAYGLVTDCDANGIPDECPCPTCECPVGLISATAPAVPPHNTRDARQPHPKLDNSLAARQGIGSASEPISIKLTTCGNIKPQCFQLCETGMEVLQSGQWLSPNSIVSVKQSYTDPYTYNLVLARPISAGHWTTIKYWAGSKKIAYASLPGDISVNSFASSTEDSLQACVNNLPVCPSSLYRKDLNHSGAFDMGDVQVLADLFSGAGTLRNWNNVWLPSNSCAQGGGGGPPHCYDSNCEGGGGGSQGMAMAPMGGETEGGEGEILTEEDFEDQLTESQRIANGLAALLTDSDPQTPEELAQFHSFVEVLTQWCVEHFDADEKYFLASWLSDPDRVFASQAGQDASEDVVEALTP